MQNRATDRQSASDKYSVQTDLQLGLSTLGLASLGATALVIAHHLGRKQYDANARLVDYIDGVFDKLGYVRKDGSAAINQDEDNSAAEHSSLQQNISVSSSAKVANESDKQSQTRKQGKAQVILDSQLRWVSGVAELQTNEFAVVGINNQRDIVWQTPMPERVHDIVIQPKALQQSVQHVAVMGRRPSASFWILKAVDGQVLHHIQAASNRHFYGHACYSLDGKYLYVTENNTQDFSGVIGVYEVATGYQKLTEFATQGIGPHELVMHPDGDTLVIANGGIKTEKASREELNIDSMQPSLVYLNRRTGALVQQVYPEHNQMSVRHLSVHPNGTVVIGIQFQGERHLSIPLVLTHQLGEAAFTTLQMPDVDTKGWYRFHHYIASVVVDPVSNLVCATSPIGGCAAVFDLISGQMLDEVDLPDCAGATLWSHDLSTLSLDKNQPAKSNKPQFLVSDGQGHLTSILIEYKVPDQPEGSTAVAVMTVDKVTQPFAFDNHLNTLAV